MSNPAWPEIDMCDVHFTAHANARALDMDVTPGELRRTIVAPRNAYWSRKHNAWTFQHGRVAVGLRRNGSKWVVLTVLWSTSEAWAADHARAPFTNGRTLRTKAGVR